MAGDGGERVAWESRARQITQAMPNVRFEFTGWVAQDQLAALMKSADLLVVPSLWPEPLGSVGPAAGHYGVPAAAFAVGAFLSGWSTAFPGIWRREIRRRRPDWRAPSCSASKIRHTTQRSGRVLEQMAATFTMERHLPELIKVLARA